MSKKPRAPRPAPTTERPLDDGARDGTEIWRSFDGVDFCHWDRWLLRLALTEPPGLASIAGEFRGRATRRTWEGRSAEAMLAQIADLEVRLGRLGLTPASALDDEERASEWLRKKAFKRVWHDGPHRSTEAMRRTPRALLEQRALRGNWSVFPSSPAPHADALSAVVGKGLYDYRGTGLVVTLLELKAEERQYAAGGLFESLTQLRTENGDFERLALHRAALTVAIEAMEQVDDSDGEMAEFFREHERAYLALVRQYAATPGLLRDLLELATWEDYGLFEGLEGFLSTLSEPHADEALRELARVIAELRREGLSYPLGKAVRLRRVLVSAAGDAPGDEEHPTG
jgi:hypothetical protein